MPHEITPVEVESPFGVTIRNHLFYHQPPVDKLMVILPGRGYLVEHPVLFHLRYLALQNGYDVLPVQYGFQALNSDFNPEQTPYLLQDMNAAVGTALARGYRQVCIAGKSLGTPLALELAQGLDVPHLSLILLTPVGTALQPPPGVRALAVMGTADSLYSADLIRASSGAHIIWEVLADLNHALLKEDDWQYSIASLHKILAVCEAFLKEVTPA